MPFIKIDENQKIILEHYRYDSLTAEEKELLGEGYIVEGVPTPTFKVGKDTHTHFNPSTQEFYFMCTDRPLSPEEELSQLKQQVVAQHAAINMILGV